MSRKEKIAEFKKQRAAEQAAKLSAQKTEKAKLSKWYSDSEPVARLDAEINEMNKRKAAIPANTTEHRQLSQMLERTLKKKVEFTQAMLENATREAEIKKRMLESRQRQQRLLEDLERVEQKLNRTKEEEAQRLASTARQEDELKTQMGQLSLLLKMQEMAENEGQDIDEEFVDEDETNVKE